MLVRDVVAAYLRHAQAVGLFCPEALEERRRTYRLFLRKSGRLQVRECRVYHLTDWIEAHKSWKSTSTKKAKANQVNACFNWAVRVGRIRRNPFAGVSYPEADPRPCLGDEALAELIARANKHYERACLFLRLTGRRLSEMARLEPADVDLERGTALLRKTKNGKPFLFPLVPEAIEVIKEALATWPPGATGPIFTNTRGTPWNRRTLGQQLRRMKQRHGIKTNGTLHGIRHQFSHEALINGAPIALVSRSLGHSGIAVTYRYYGHLAEEIEATREVAMKSTQ